jgi:RimJ/RimL family protein N-acetyltransferase
LRGTWVRLTALTLDDIPILVGWYQDTEFLRLFDSRPAYPKSPAQLGQWLEELHKEKNTFVFGVHLVHSDELIGYLELDEIDWQHGVCGLGVGIGDRTKWGRGYGGEAVRLAIGFAFDELNLHRVQVTVFDYNARSIALFERLGFQREGTIREFLQRSGKRHDMILYGVLRQEWEALQRANRPGGG